MARTAVSYSNWVANSNLSDPAGTTLDATNDHVINAAVPELTVLRVTNTSGSDRIVTVKAGSGDPAWRRGQGDLSVTVTATTGVQFIGPLSSSRFLQPDGTLQVDIVASHTGTITAFKLPRAT
ncbi:hypothetical protein [Streptomyces sp. NPDC056661]|uniref:hypothetical protein n=1 Tax=Streptomyces sp. NPDC056661 TaxID=3345898 RepID=UPI0036AA9EEA